MSLFDDPPIIAIIAKNSVKQTNYKYLFFDRSSLKFQAKYATNRLTNLPLLLLHCDLHAVGLT